MYVCIMFAHPEVGGNGSVPQRGGWNKEPKLWHYLAAFFKIEADQVSLLIHV